MNNDLFQDYCEHISPSSITLKLLENLCGIEDKILPICGICNNFSLDVIFDSCGHMACIVCSSQITKCHICRQNIKKKIEFYIN